LLLGVSDTLFQRGDDENIAYFAFAGDSVLLKPWPKVDLVAAGHNSPHVL
jgi:hypothetical protein